VFSAIALLAMVGCADQGPFDDLDRRVAQMIDQRQDQTLGPQAANDPHPIPAPATSASTPTTDHIHQTKPATVNPATDGLPVRKRGTPQAPPPPPPPPEAISQATPQAAPAATPEDAAAPALDATVPAPTPDAPAPASDAATPAATPGASNPAQATDSSALPTPGNILDLEAHAPVFTLEKCLGYALAHSREYRGQKEILFVTALDLIAQRHLWGPRFFDTVTSRFTGTPEAGDHEQAATLINDFSVRQRLPYGGEISVGALVTYVNELRQHSSDAGRRDEQTGALRAALDLPLLRGAGMAARENLIQAERDLTYAVRSFERFRREFLVDIASDFFGLMRQRREIDNIQRQAQNLQWLAQRTTALADAGRVPYFEVQRSEQQVLFARNNLVNSQESYANALNAFKIRLGYPVDEPLALAPIDFEVPEPALEPQAAVAAALAYRLDLQNTADQVDDAHRKVRVAANNMLPDLDLFADVTLPTDASQQYAGFNLEPDDSRYTAGLIFQAPLDRVIERTGYRQAMVSLHRAQRSLDLEQQRVSEDVRRAIRRIEQSSFTLALQKQNIQIARQRLRGVLLRLRELGPRDFIEAQEDLLEAQNRRDAARRDLRISILDFLLATGQMRVTAAGQWDAPAALAPEPLPAEGTDDVVQMLDAANQGMPPAAPMLENSAGGGGE
jgi:outer membrane protein TolC